MSSYAISGKPGGGKTLYSVFLILEELESTDRVVVTNIPLNIDNIVKYFSLKGKDVDVYSRIVLLEHSQTKEFWRYRSNNLILDNVSPAEYKAGKLPDFSKIENGVVYFLDELHEHLNSREWQNTGPIVLYYIAKHRHLGDDVYWITQSINNVDRQWRSVTQEYRYARNFSKEMFWGFSKGSNFLVQSYLEPFTGTQSVQWEKKFKLDKSIADCYNTSLFNKKADVASKKFGILNLKWLFFFIALIFFVVIALFMYIPHRMTKNAISDMSTPDVQASFPSTPSIFSNQPSQDKSPNSDFYYIKTYIFDQWIDMQIAFPDLNFTLFGKDELIVTGDKKQLEILQSLIPPKPKYASTLFADIVGVFINGDGPGYFLLLKCGTDIYDGAHYAGGIVQNVEKSSFEVLHQSGTLVKFSKYAKDYGNERRVAPPLP